MKKFKDTKLGKFIKLKAPKGLEVAGDLLPDEGLLGVVKNLIDNAFKFTKSGSIELGYEINKRYIEFRVSDTGIGISSDRLSKIYSNFSRLWHRDGEVLYEGLGIGLSTAKNFIDILGGIIQVQSEENKGTSFYFSIPLLMEGNPLTIDQIDIKDPYQLLS